MSKNVSLLINFLFFELCKKKNYMPMNHGDFLRKTAFFVDVDLLY